MAGIERPTGQATHCSILNLKKKKKNSFYFCGFSNSARAIQKFFFFPIHFLLLYTYFSFIRLCCLAGHCRKRETTPRSCPVVLSEDFRIFPFHFITRRKILLILVSPPPFFFVPLRQVLLPFIVRPSPSFFFFFNSLKKEFFQVPWNTFPVTFHPCCIFNCTKCIVSCGVFYFSQWLADFVSTGESFPAFIFVRLLTTPYPYVHVVISRIISAYRSIYLSRVFGFNQMKYKKK